MWAAIRSRTITISQTDPDLNPPTHDPSFPEIISILLSNSDGPLFSNISGFGYHLLQEGRVSKDPLCKLSIVA